MENNNFEICVRGIIFQDDNILLCHHIKDRTKTGYYFFPGGHVEFGEKAEDALARELKEELNLSIKEISYIGSIENIFEQNKEKHHEINLVFNVMAENIKDKSQEDHIEFLFLNKEKFAVEKVLPLVLRDAVIKWQKDKKFFWLSKDETKNKERKKRKKGGRFTLEREIRHT
ncbi:MAG: NUDIX domain-containing protein [Candidatus Nealsonbacteria bacterium]|nr:NUDIX domain-containing protein [Candidatus Nealsonbacteria bacterium]